ncbi:hypothetical protein FKW77_001392 [Venturia effusa]|uniref:CBM1 domain-containing protein n=1 Tax=Venturia effusa TaxID=50376 RepID=A0A517LNF4_9PEZI|nr:hypothetical protein FKW77_001392 [Venturia effusa]
MKFTFSFTLLAVLGLTSTALACVQPGKPAEYNDCTSCCHPWGCSGTGTRKCNSHP